MSQAQRIQAQQQKQKLLALIGNAQMAIGALESFCCYTNNTRYMGESCVENVECAHAVNAQLATLGTTLMELEQVFGTRMEHAHMVG